MKQANHSELKDAQAMQDKDQKKSILKTLQETQLLQLQHLQTIEALK